jgi:hypothetical protein
MNKLIIPLLFFSVTLFSQKDSAPNWDLRGYLKNMQTTFFAKLPFSSESTMFNDQLLHNRLKFRWYPSEKFTLHAELRNRVFWGDQVRTTLQFGGDYIESISLGGDDFFDWSAGYQNKKGYALHTTLDRFYAEYTAGQWEVRLGRQRVNWGIGTIWNPNDIFNAFSFTDFDYEERPGSDALRVRRYTGAASSIEVTVNAFRHWDEATAAILARFNTGTYDWQVLAGVVENYAVLGGGWAGNLGDASFKGEASFFTPLGDSLDNSFALTAGIDYTFGNQIYLNAGLLYNSNGSTGSGADDLFTFELSARNLYPYRYSALVQVMYPLTPLLNGNLIAVYSPGEAHALFLDPALTYSLAQNWDLDVVVQVVFQKTTKYESPVQAGFLRIKWSF